MARLSLLVLLVGVIFVSSSFAAEPVKDMEDLYKSYAKHVEEARKQEAHTVAKDSPNMRGVKAPIPQEEEVEFVEEKSRVVAPGVVSDEPMTAEDVQKLIPPGLIPKRIPLMDHLDLNTNTKEYYAEVRVGPIQYNIVMDTGSVSVWLPHLNCKSCGGRALYDGGPNWAASNDTFLIEYSNGDWVAGIKTVADIQVAGLLVKGQEIGAVLVTGGPRHHMLTSEPFQFYQPGGKVDGVIGLDLPQFVSTSTQPGADGQVRSGLPFFDTMMTQGLAAPPKFSFYFGKPHSMNGTDDVNDSFMALGGADPDFYYPPLFWVLVENGPQKTLASAEPEGPGADGVANRPMPGPAHSWLVRVSHFQIGDMVWKCDDCVASVDTGSSKIVVPANLFPHFQTIAKQMDCQRLFSGLMPRIGFYLAGIPDYGIEGLPVRPRQGYGANNYQNQQSVNQARMEMGNYGNQAYQNPNMGGMSRQQMGMGGQQQMGMGGMGSMTGRGRPSAENPPPPQMETRNFLLDPGDYVFNTGYTCTSSIIPGDDHFVFGTPFLRKYYSVFDREGPRNAPPGTTDRIGFAVAR